MNEIIGFIISLAILSGLAAGIYFIIKGKIHNAKKWHEMKRWAKSQGYVLPKKTGVFGIFLIIVAYMILIFPGVILTIAAIRRDQNYEKEMRIMMNKWIDAGKPRPLKE